MRLSLVLLSLAALTLAGCVDVHEHPAPRSATVVTPPASGTAYAAPGSSTTVVTHP